jgi:hypothetical protein
VALRRRSKSFAAGSLGAHAIAATFGLGASIALVTSCGARTGLPVPEIVAGDTSKGGMMPEAGPDAFDAAPDVQEDVIPPPDECPEGGTKTFIYLITEEAHLLAYDPPLKTYHDIGVINCPFEGGNPFSMGVARNGTAYAVYEDGSLYKVSTRDASCEDTTYISGQSGFERFGMGYSSDTDDPGEKLYVADISGTTTVSKGLATIDTTTFQLNFINPFSENPGDALEMTGTGDGRLFGFFIQTGMPGGTIAQIDKTNATILSQQFVPMTGTSNEDLAFAFWGGDFFIFTSSEAAPPTTVTRVSGDASDVETTIPLRVVGAGVSTCAPAQ